MTIKPLALKTGDTIGIMAPSSVIDKGELDSALKILEQRGFNVEIHPQTYARNQSAAGTEEQKAQALNDLFQNKSIRAIFAAGGGNHSLFLLNAKTDFAVIRRNPKIFMGFSDATALLNAFNARASLTTFHGPVVKWLSKTKDVDHVFAVLAGEQAVYPTDDMLLLRTGRAVGPLIGGNLTMINYLAGTKFMPKADGAILFLEDLNEEYSNLDRLFWKLKATGILDKIAGLVIGQISDPKDSSKRPYGFSLEDIIARHITGLTIPVVSNASFGHNAALNVLPIGCPARLSVQRDRIVFSLEEPAVR